MNCDHEGCHAPATCYDLPRMIAVCEAHAPAEPVDRGLLCPMCQEAVMCHIGTTVDSDDIEQSLRLCRHCGTLLVGDEADVPRIAVDGYGAERYEAVCDQSDAALDAAEARRDQWRTIQLRVPLELFESLSKLAQVHAGDEAIDDEAQPADLLGELLEPLANALRWPDAWERGPLGQLLDRYGKHDTFANYDAQAHADSSRPTALGQPNH